MEEALVGFLGTRDMMAQFWPAAAPFLTILGVASGLAALAMFFGRWMADYKKWRREQIAQRKAEALRRLYYVKKYLSGWGAAAPPKQRSLILFYGSFWQWGSSGKT